MLFSARVLVLGLVATFGCSTPSGGTRVVQSTHTGGPAKPAKEVKPQPKRDPLIAREEELLAILSSKKVRALQPDEQSLARAMAMQEIASLRVRRNDLHGAEEAIERAVNEGLAAHDPGVAEQMSRERFRIYRLEVKSLADRQDFAGSMRVLDRMSLFPETTAAEKQQIAGDRFIISEQRAESAAKSKGMAVPGEEQSDTAQVMAEVERVFGATSSFAAPDEDATAVMKSIEFELNAATGGESTVQIVGLPHNGHNAEEKAAPSISSSQTRGHELASNERVTLDLTSHVDTKMAALLDSPAKKELPVDIPRADAMPLVETGKFDPRTIAALVSLNKRSVARCYDRSLRAGERLTGKLEVKITVQPTGLVSGTEIGSQEHATTELGRCVASTIGRWRFPPFTGEKQQVTIPFFLKGSF